MALIMRPIEELDEGEVKLLIKELSKHRDILPANQAAYLCALEDVRDYGLAKGLEMSRDRAIEKKRAGIKKTKKTSEAIKAAQQTLLGASPEVQRLIAERDTAIGQAATSKDFYQRELEAMDTQVNSLESELTHARIRVNELTGKNAAIGAQLLIRDKAIEDLWHRIEEINNATFFTKLKRLF